MIYKDFLNNDVSLLGFGLMRLPLLDDKKTINEPLLRDMVDYAIKHGVNYFDTAYPYHEGKSEIAIGNILKDYPRESFYLADKYPGHQTVEKFTPRETFEEQLEKCKVDYFDYYLLHNVTEYSFDTYTNKDIGIVDYFVEEKKKGRIKNLGFSTHGKLECVKKFLEIYGDKMDFVQIQMNFLDYTLQNAKDKYEYLTDFGLPIIAMEPLRGGKFAKNCSDAFRWIERFDNIKVILSGMSNMDQIMENVAIFHAEKPLSDLDTVGLYQLADTMKNMVPCTACHYCDGCPKNIDIPLMMQLTSEARFGGGFSVTMHLESIGNEKGPKACISCNKCVRKCPQAINIPEVMKELSALWDKMPKWSDVCKEREEASKRLKLND